MSFSLPIVPNVFFLAKVNIPTLVLLLLDGGGRHNRATLRFLPANGAAPGEGHGRENAKEAKELFKSLVHVKSHSKCSPRFRCSWLDAHSWMIELMPQLVYEVVVRLPEPFL